MTHSEFGNWMSGFTDGEGSFGVYKQYYKAKNGSISTIYLPRFTIHLRLDDLPVLLMIKDTLGIGSLRTRSKSGGSNPSAHFFVNKATDQIIIVDLFEQYPLRSKKRYQFDIYKNCVQLKQIKTKDCFEPDYLIWAYEEMARLKLYMTEPSLEEVYV